MTSRKTTERAAAGKSTVKRTARETAVPRRGGETLYEPVAVLDLGAYSARLEVCQKDRATGQVMTIEQISHPLPLGRDVFKSGMISPDSMRQAERLMQDFAQKMDELRVRHRRAVATSAVRESLNRDVFIHRIQQRTGIQIETLDGSMEIRLMSLAVRRVLGDELFARLSSSALLFVVGTGSSQLAYYRDAYLRSADTIRLGTLRLGEELGQRLTHEEMEDVVDPFVAAIVSGAARLWPGAKPRNLIAVGAPVRGLLALASRDSGQAVGSLTRDGLAKLFGQLEGPEGEKLARKAGLPIAVLQSLEPCCHILDHLFRVTDADRVYIPTVNTRDALLDDLYRTLESAGDPFVPDMLSAASAMGERYRHDERHGHVVTALAVQLFDGLKELHHLAPRDRVLLQVASILHDVGLFVSGRQHHKHSYYLIANSELPGITAEEQELIALVARYHRRASPKVSHPEYMVLPPQRRILVSQLAAILRVADALDRGHRGRVRVAQVKIEGQRVALRVRSDADFTVEQWALKDKSDMFEEVFGYKVELIAES